MPTRHFTPSLSRISFSHAPIGLTITLTIALFLLAMSAGCSSSRYTSLDPQVVPAGFEMTIGMYDTQGKHTYMVLDDKGELSFAGGKAAILRQPYYVLTLTAAQRQDVWSQIISSNMLTTKNQMFKSPNTVAYDVEIDPGKSFGSRSFHVVDAAVPPAVIKLHDQLFKLQGTEQYKPNLPAKSNP